MVLHQEFATKHEVRDLVDKAVRKNGFEVDIVKSKPRLYVLKCRGVVANGIYELQNYITQIFSL
ncbi:unnamed protein product [Brassica oleracea var. botrytis]